MATMINIKSKLNAAIQGRYVNIANALSLRKDRPYGTPLVATSYLTGGNVQGIGKVADLSGTNILYRSRAALQFSIPAGLANPSNLTLRVTMPQWNNTLESWVPAFYASNTVYATGFLPSSWETQIDVPLGVLVYGVTTEQRLVIPSTLIGAHAGGNLLIIAGNQLEMTNAGVGLTMDGSSNFSLTNTALDLQY